MVTTLAVSGAAACLATLAARHLALRPAPTLALGVSVLALLLGVQHSLARRAARARTGAFLRGKRVWITGASSGLGRSLALAASRHGAQVVLTARRETVLQEVATLCVAAGCSGAPTVIAADLGGDSKTLVGLVAVHGLEDVDVLVNNAGVSSRSRCEDTDIAVDERLMRVNFLGQVAVTKGTRPAMLARGEGRLVFVSSVQGLLALPFRSSYSASKHALQGYCDCLRAEVAARGVQVLVVSAGYIATSLSLNAVTGEGVKYGRTDATTAAGADPDALAEDILAGVAAGDVRMMPAPLHARLAVVLQWLLPAAIDRIMAGRYRRQAHELKLSN